MSQGQIYIQCITHNIVSEIATKWNFLEILENRHASKGKMCTIK